MEWLLFAIAIVECPDFKYDTSPKIELGGGGGGGGGGIGELCLRWLPLSQFPSLCQRSIAYNGIVQAWAIFCDIWLNFTSVLLYYWIGVYN